MRNVLEMPVRGEPAGWRGPRSRCRGRGVAKESSYYRTCVVAVETPSAFRRQSAPCSASPEHVVSGVGRIRRPCKEGLPGHGQVHVDAVAEMWAWRTSPLRSPSPLCRRPNGLKS